MSLRLSKWRCWLFGHDFPLLATWRWSHSKGAMVELGKRAQQRAKLFSKTCTRCGARKEQ